MSICIQPFVYMNYCLCLSFTDDSWEMLRDSSNQHLSFGLFQFHKKVVSTYTKSQQQSGCTRSPSFDDYASAGGFLNLWKNLTHLRQSNIVFEDVK